jgi:hypothetical protein
VGLDLLAGLARQDQEFGLPFQDGQRGDRAIACCRRRLEHGTTRPYRATVQRLALALELTPDDQIVFWAAGQPAPRQRQLASRLPVSREPSYRHNLPTPLTSFIGRERELSEVQARLAGARLVTLTGVGGCGKTRLALGRRCAGPRRAAVPGPVPRSVVGEGALLHRRQQQGGAANGGHNQQAWSEAQVGDPDQHGLSGIASEVLA